MKRPVLCPQLLLVLCTSLLALVACGGGPAGPGSAVPYPSVLQRLPADSLVSRYSACSLANPGLCFQLDPFGLMSTINSYPPAVFHGAGIGSSVDTVRLVDVVHGSLARNSAYTGVTSDDALVLQAIVPNRLQDPSRDHFRVDFRPQVYEGLTVEDTNVRVYMDSAAVLTITGHHYGSINVPDAAVTAQVAGGVLVGREIRWFDAGGNERVFVVTEESLHPAPFLVIVPVETQVGMELHLAWRCSIDGSTRWAGFVDAVTGDFLEIRQLFNP